MLVNMDWLMKALFVYLKNMISLCRVSLWLNYWKWRLYLDSKQI